VRLLLWLTLVVALALLGLYLRSWGYYPHDDILGK
jgi:hypothetical protein